MIMVIYFLININYIHIFIKKYFNYINFFIDIIPLSDSSESSSGLPSLKRKAPVSSTSNVSNSNDVIVLISDDSDEDDLPLKKRNPNPPDLNEAMSIEVPCDPSYITADSTTSQDFNGMFIRLVLYVGMYLFYKL